MEKSEVLKIVWELTRPSNLILAQRYLKALDIVVSTPKRQLYNCFPAPKKNGGNRIIYAAGKDLRIIQSILAYWVVGHFPLGDDYCYHRGRGVFASVKKHQQSKFALVFDLKNAFESITASMIEKRLKACFLEAGIQVEEEAIAFIIDLLTVNGRTRQGCVSSPIIYNFVIKPLDEELGSLKNRLGSLVLTRYSDNICFSSAERIDFVRLEREISRIVKDYGFSLSWFKKFEGQPIVYLGTRIWRGKLALAPDKHLDFYDKILEALQSPTPSIYRYQITGILNWAYLVCGEDIPDDLASLFYRYFAKVGRTPKKLAEILSKRQQKKMI